MLTKPRSRLVGYAIYVLTTMSLSACSSTASHSTGAAGNGTSSVEGGSGAAGGSGSDGVGGVSGTNSAGANGISGAGNTTNNPNGPIIIRLTANVAQLTENESVKVIAVVSEPSGLENLVGGSLGNQDGSKTYGAFIAAQQGTYEVSVSWADLQRSTPLDFVGEQQHVFAATFWNKAGQSNTGTVTLRLHCNRANVKHPAACGGVCTSVETAERCGSCDKGCKKHGYLPECTPELTCAAVHTPPLDLARTCTEYCRSKHNVPCTSAIGYWNIGSLGESFSMTCDQVPLELPPPKRSIRYSGLECQCAGAEMLAGKLGVTCSATCAQQNLACESTAPAVTKEVGGGFASFNLSDTCEPPYSQPVDWLTKNPGGYIAVNDNISVVRCFCAETPR